VVTLRSLGAALVVALWLALTRQAVLPQGIERRYAIIIGLLIGVQSFAHYTAFSLIHIGLAVLVFFLFPMFTLIATAVMERRLPAPTQIVAVLIAFVGLALALAPGWSGAMAGGVALALLAATTFTVYYILAGRWFKTKDPRPRTVVMLAMAGMPVALIGAGGGYFATPHSIPGWLAAFAVPVFYLIGFVAMMHAVRVIGPVQATMLMNVEPIATLIIAALLTEQSLAPIQWVGASLVVAALFLATRPRT
jgi:drug/metabolite transporter (DMT)-like permease